MMGDDKQYRGLLHHIQAIRKPLLYQIQATVCGRGAEGKVRSLQVTVK